MKKLIVLLALLMVSQAHAQQGREGYGENPGAVVVPVESAGQPVNQGNPIYIINKNKVQGSQEANQGTTQGATQAASQGVRQGAVQEQPVSVVQEAPLKVSAAEQMRKSRQDSEAVTEDGIVQALERARMQDEIKRRDRFNNAIAPVEPDQTVTTTTVVQQQQVVQQPQPVAPPIQRVERVEPVREAQPIQKIHVVEEEEDVSEFKEDKRDVRDDRADTRVDTKQEISAKLDDQKKKDEERETYYVSALASFGQYNNVVNVDKSLGYGFAIGTTTVDRLVVEASFIYGDYQLTDMYVGGCYAGNCYPEQVDMRQYNIGAAVKYQLLPGRFRPVVGAILSYTRRSYSIDGQDFRTSDAADVGALVGADLVLTQSFALGLDFRYMTNLGYRQNADPGEIVYQQANDPEKLDYYTLNLLAKFMF